VDIPLGRLLLSHDVGVNEYDDADGYGSFDHISFVQRTKNATVVSHMSDIKFLYITPEDTT